MSQRDSSEQTQLTINGISATPEQKFDSLKGKLKNESSANTTYILSDDESDLTALEDMSTPSSGSEIGETESVPVSVPVPEIEDIAVFQDPESDPESDNESDKPPISEDERPTLQEKLKSGPRTTYSQNRNLSVRNGRIKTSSTFGNDDEGELFPGSQRTTKRVKTNKTYGSQKTIYRAPSSSALSSKLQEKAEEESSEDSEKKPSGPTFKMPPVLPIESGSSFSLMTSSSKDTQPTTVFDESSHLSGRTSMSPLPEFKPERPESPREAICPLCKAPVDLGLLLIFEAQPKQRFREQVKFCASHRQATAEKEWKAQGYPEIDWDTFTERAQTHFKYIQGLVNADTPSYYRNILDSAFKSGKALRLTLEGDGVENISCGYYGTKGTQKLLELLMERFSVTLRRLAKNDRLIAEATIVGYAQSVLVPELGVRLIKEDMGVDDETARQIMRESIDIGQRVNPAQNDVVHYEPKDEEDEQLDL
ncbi:hypothetical protein N7495_005446 [Penicillium taxi]|uniref:uncharacterized protein n=1 Tax=Penicillium taxi TaxID=168475 RepID=UPI0025457C9A|nr:uncharacterized protein N7495_005446 [Penicillium taxi]KAJ5893755.1 hypothetical protein N7495_005446 [Penicillium taxi]